MKLLILQFCAFGTLGFILEWTFRIIRSELSLRGKLRKLKLLIMILIYGIACTIISLLYKIPFFSQIEIFPLLMLICGTISTAIELVFGCLLNILLKLDIWNYSNCKLRVGSKIILLNFMGQINIFHSFLWCFLTIPVCYFSSIIKFLAS